MELSKFKLEFYDLLGILIPGVLSTCLLAYLLLPPAVFAGRFSQPTTTLLTFGLLAGFAAGQVIQEASDALVRRVRGPRFLKKCRDEFWASPAAAPVRARILAECGVSELSADAAFEYCLSSVSSHFMKRDTFIAVSDMARSLWCLSVLSLSAVVLHYSRISEKGSRVYFLLKALTLLALTAWLCWRRMVRFRFLSESPVFSTFLALPRVAPVTPGLDVSSSESEA